jgi:hypothetical protein
MDPDMCTGECASRFQTYLAITSRRLDPYAAAIESRNSKVRPVTFIASSGNELKHVEAEKYATKLIAAALRTTVARCRNVAHGELASQRDGPADIDAYFLKKLGVTAERS